MVRLTGVELPQAKQMAIALTYIYGIGRARANKILADTGVNPTMRAKDISDEDISKLREYLEENYQLEGDLRREVAANIRRKIEINSYQGSRHRRSLPVHGQRTKTNARSRKGPKKTVAGKKRAGKR
jgi:small subunit ribosomal protein S13